MRERELAHPVARTRSSVVDRLRDWAPAILWAAMIFYASTDAFSSQNTGRVLTSILQWLIPAISRDQVDLVNFAARKCAHFVEYFVLYLLVHRGVAAGRPDWRGSRAMIAWLIVVAYSLLDELHQSFVATRTGSPWDSLLDAAGGIFGMLVVFLWVRMRATGTRRARAESDR